MKWKDRPPLDTEWTAHPPGESAMALVFFWKLFEPGSAVVRAMLSLLGLSIKELLISLKH